VTGRVTPHTVSRPVSSWPSKRSDVNVMTGCRAMSSRRADRTLASRCRLDLRAGRRSGERLGEVDRPAPDREAAVNRRDAEQVPGLERDGRVAGVELVPAELGCGRARCVILVHRHVPIASRPPWRAAGRAVGSGRDEGRDAAGGMRLS